MEAQTKNGFMAFFSQTCPALDKNDNRAKLSRVQRSACLGVTGSIRSTLSETLNVLLHYHPIDIHIKRVISCTADGGWEFDRKIVWSWTDTEVLR